MSHVHFFPPRLLGADAAAYYLGISPSKLRTLGLQRKVDGGNRLYELSDLDRWADSLSYENCSQPERSTATDAAFGVS